MQHATEPAVSASRAANGLARRLALLGATALVAVSPTLVGTARAQSQPPAAGTVEIVGSSDIGKRGHNAGVWSYRGFAYVGSAWRAANDAPAACQSAGISILDLADPRKPQSVSTAAEYPGAFAEAIHVVAVESPSFRGDMLAVGLQRCAPQGRAGLSLWDVTDPRKPAELGFYELEATSIGVTSVSLFRRDNLTYALLGVAVPFVPRSASEQTGDVRIVDVSDATHPVLASQWSFVPPLAGIPPPSRRDPTAAGLIQSVRLGPDGRIVFVSADAAGVIMLDISDLRDPRIVGRAVANTEGAAAAVRTTTSAKGGRILIHSDEVADTAPWILSVDSATGPKKLAIRVLNPAVDRAIVAARDSTLWFEGEGCSLPIGSSEPPAPDAQPPKPGILIIQPGGCSLIQKLSLALTRGASGVLIVSESADRPPGPASELLADVSAPVAYLARSDAASLIDALKGGAAIRASFEAPDPAMLVAGVLRFWDITEPSRPVLVTSYRPHDAPDEARHRQPDDVCGSIRDIVAQGDRLYVAWCDRGLRIFDIADPTQPREIASFAPPAAETPQAAQAPPAFWGIYPRGDLILATDVQRGLFVLRESGRD